MTLKTTLREMLPVVQITRSAELKELQQRVGKARERQQRRSEQLDRFQDIGVHLSVNAIYALQVMHERKNEVVDKLVEHPLVQDLT